MADPIVIVRYDPDWVKAFEHTRELLLYALNDVDVQIEHIGSTSVPGLDAKPIIDMMIVAQTEGDALRCITPIVRLGYECLGEAGIPGRIFFRRTNPRTHHIHLYTTATNPERERHLMFRDYLRAHAEAAQEYAQLKYLLADKYREDRDRYSRSKSDFVERIVQEARDERAKQKLDG